VCPISVDHDFTVTDASQRIPLFQMRDCSIKRSHLERYSEYLFRITLLEAQDQVVSSAIGTLSDALGRLDEVKHKDVASHMEPTDG
jgi:hypothetical protein